MVHAGLRATSAHVRTGSREVLAHAGATTGLDEFSVSSVESSLVGIDLDPPLPNASGSLAVRTLADHGFIGRIRLSVVSIRHGRNLGRRRLGRRVRHG